MVISVAEGMRINLRWELNCLMYIPWSNKYE